MSQIFAPNNQYQVVMQVAPEFHLDPKQALSMLYVRFFFNDPATPEIYTSIDTLSLHDALPISGRSDFSPKVFHLPPTRARPSPRVTARDRKSTRLNSSHQSTSRMPSSA